MRSALITILISFTALAHCCAQQLPKPAHIIIVVEENHGYDEVIGSPNAPFITQLARQGALFTDAHGVVHPSQPNYLALFSGSTQDVTDDRCLGREMPYNTPNLGADLLAAGFSFRGYAQTLPKVGALDCISQVSSLTGQSLYARKHCPWVNWQGNGKNNVSATLSRPMTDFPKNFNKLPTVGFVIPDMDHDMHNIGAPGDAAAIRRGDQWLKSKLAAYAHWAKKHNSLLIVTFDEDDFQTVNHIPTIIVGGPVAPGKYGGHIDHYNVLHTIDRMYGITPKDPSNADPVTGCCKTK